MKILLVTHFFPPTHTAGTEKRTFGYATELQKLGHQVQVVCVGKWNAGYRYWNGFRDEIYCGIPVRRIDLNWTLAPDINRYLYDNPLIERHLDKWLDLWQPDIVHITSCLTLSASVIRAAKKKKLPVVFTLTDFWTICPKINLVRDDKTLCSGITTSSDCVKCLMGGTKAYQRLKSLAPDSGAVSILMQMSKLPFVGNLRGLRGMLLDMDERMAVLSETIGLVDRLTAPSSSLAEIIQQSGKISHPVQVIYSGHDLSWMANMPAKSPSNQVRFGFIGQIIPVKGLHLLISAFKNAGIQHEAQLKIFGDSEANPQYADTIRELIGDWKNIELLGPFPHDQLGNVLSQIDVLIVPSQWHENNPRVMQESFASKTPVLASNVGGIAEFVKHGVNGLLFEHNRVDELSQRLHDLVSDPTLIGRLQSGIQPIRTMQDEVGEIFQVYQDVLSLTKKEL